MNQTATPVRRLSTMLISVVGDRLLIGLIAGLIVARPLVDSADPGRLRLTTSGTSIWFNLLIWVSLLGVCCWKMLSGRHVRWRGIDAVLALGGIGAIALINARQEGVYARPSLFLGWEWLTLAVLCFVVRQLITSAEDRRGVVNVIVASVLSVGSIGLFQQFGNKLGLPSTEPEIADARPGLVGIDEFQAWQNQPIYGDSPIRGTCDSAETFLVYLLLGLPFVLLVCLTLRQPLKWLLLLGWGSCIAVCVNSKIASSGTQLGEGIRLVKEHLLSGVGLGNFSRFASDGIVASGSAWLTLAACGGVLSLLLFLVVCRPLLALRQTTDEPADEIPLTTRWEFYLGGVWGLLIGFLCLAGQMPAEAPVWEIYKIGGYAVVRGAIWLMLFGMLEKLAYRPKFVIWAMAAAMGIVLILGSFTEAAGNMTLLFHVVVLAACLLASRDQHAPQPIDPMLNPVMVMACVAVASVILWYLFTAATPGWRTADYTRKARMASRMYPDLERQIDIANIGVERANARTLAATFLKNQILGPLRKANEFDPTNAILLLEIARWERVLWKINVQLDPKEAATVSKNLLRNIEQAAKLDPRSVAPDQATLEALLLYRRESNSKATERLEAFHQTLEKVTRTHPQLEVPYRYQMVMVLLKNGDTDAVEREIVPLLKLARVPGHPHGELTEYQRTELLDLAKKSLKNPPKELLEEWVN